MTGLQDYFAGKTARLRNQVALVCGAGIGGIGAPIAQRLGWAGCRVVVVDLTMEKAQQTADLIGGEGGTCLPLAADLRDRDQAAAIVPAVLDAFGRIDLVCNVAGGTRKAEQLRAIEETGFDIYDDLFALNCAYSFQICRDAAAAMIAQGEGGSIVNIGSVSGIRSAAYHAAYGAAKAALMQLTRSMATEWGRYGIRANCVAPGSVLTGRNIASGLDYGKRAREWAPLGVPVQPEDIADAAFFLLSDLAGRITGQILSVDAGVTAISPIGDSDHLARRMVPAYHAEHFRDDA